MKLSAKKYILIYGITLSIALIFVIGLTVWIDPYFHYHKPVEGFTYSLDNQRYQNYGILKNFKYNSMITGTSMTENFKPSELDTLLEVNSVKTSFSGGYYKELDQAIKYAIEKNDDLKLVIRALDTDVLIRYKDILAYETSNYPWYLYDNNIFNDTSYVFNKETLITKTIPIYTTKGTTSITSFDIYSNWMSSYKFGKDVTLELYSRATTKADKQVNLTDGQIVLLKDNIQQNVIETISDNPDIEFYYFIPPYSIIWWDIVNNNGTLNSELEAHKILIEELLPYKNCKLFSFNTQFDIITNLDNYKDAAHYHADINSYILEQMAKGENLLTYDNYENYLKKLNEFYTNYDYDSIFV